MQEIAKIVENRGRKAIVKIVRRSACDKCKHNCLLAGDDDEQEIEEMEVEVYNPSGFKAGTKVKLEMEEKPLLFASLLIYIGPLIAFMLGYFVGSWFADFVGFFSRQNTGIFTSFLFLVLSFLVLNRVDKHLSKYDSYHPRITEKLD